MNAYSILIDSSVWIEYFRTGRPDKLDRIIEEGLACINELILSELVPPLILKKETGIIEGLKATGMVPMNIDWDIIRDYQVMNLRNCINRVGIPDLIILQQVIDQKITLFSFDKHFKLMQNHLTFDLISE
ncbi:MAG: PIN domain-containing protein [Cyclonatronaceae bacterium]